MKILYTVTATSVVNEPSSGAGIYAIIHVEPTEFSAIGDVNKEKVHFIDNIGAECEFHREYWNASLQKALFIVRLHKDGNPVSSLNANEQIQISLLVDAATDQSATAESCLLKIGKEDNGNVIDESGFSGLNVAVPSGISFASTDYGNALDFSGGQLHINSVAGTSSTRTVLMWFDHTDTSNEMLFGFYVYDCYPITTMGYNSNSNAYSTGYTTSANTWYHLGAVVTGTGNMVGNKMYINGVNKPLSWTNGSGNGYAVFQSYINLSGWGVNTSYRLYGYEAQVYYFDRELSDGEINSFYLFGNNTIEVDKQIVYADTNLYTATISNKLKIRYVRDWLNGNTVNTSNHWVEIKVFDSSGTNVALNKSVTSNGTINTSYKPLSALVDNDTNTADYINAGANGLTYVQIDLGQEYDDIDNTVVWHYYSDGRTYHNTKTEVSADGINWITVFDSAASGEYAETSSGHTISITEQMAGIVEQMQNINVYKIAITDIDFFKKATAKEYIRIWSDAFKTQAILYWIEYFDATSNEAYIWVKYTVNANTYETLYIDIDSSRTTDASSGSSVFTYFDDFSADTSWSVGPGVTYTVSNGQINTDSTGSTTVASGMIYKINPLTDNYEIHMRIKPGTTSSDARFGIASHINELQLGTNTDYKWCSILNNYRASISALVFTELQEYVAYKAYTSYTWDSSHYYNIVQAVSNTTVKSKVWVEGSTEPDWQITDTFATNNQANTRFGIYTSQGCTSSSDYIFVLPYYSIKPIITIRSVIPKQQKYDISVSNNNNVDSDVAKIQFAEDKTFFDLADNKQSSIRVYSDDTFTTAASYWIEEWDTANYNATIWVKLVVPLNSTKHVYLEVNNLLVDDLSNIDEVFTFGDDFRDETALDTNKWTPQGNYNGWYVSSGALIGPYTGTTVTTKPTLFANTAIDNNFILEYSAKHTGTIGTYPWMGVVAKTINTYSNYGQGYLCIAYANGGSTYANKIRIVKTANSSTTTELNVLDVAVPYNVWNKYKVSYNEGNITYDMNGNIISASDSTYVDNYFRLIYENGNIEAEYQYVFAHKYLSTDLVINITPLSNAHVTTIAVEDSSIDTITHEDFEGTAQYTIEGTAALSTAQADSPTHSILLPKGTASPTSTLNFPITWPSDGYLVVEANEWVVNSGHIHLMVFTTDKTTGWCGPHTCVGQVGTTNDPGILETSYSSAWHSTGYTLPTAQWVKVRMVIDISAATYDVYINDVKQISSNLFIAAVMPGSTIYLQFDNWNNNDTDFYVDDVSITHVVNDTIVDPSTYTYDPALTVSYATKLELNSSICQYADSKNSLRVYSDPLLTTPIPYWIEDFDKTTDTASIWIKPVLNAESSTNIYLHIDNNLTTDNSDTDSTFIFGDDFNGTSLDTNKWIIANDGGSATVSDGKLRLYGGSTSSGYIDIVTAKNDFTHNIVVITKGMSISSGTIMVELYVQSTTGRPALDSGAIDQSDYSVSVSGWNHAITEANGSSWDLLANSGWLLPINQWFIDEFISKTNNYTFIAYDANRILQSTISATKTGTNTSGRLLIEEYNGRTTDFDYIFVHEYLATEPVSTPSVTATIDTNMPSAMNTGQTYPAYISTVLSNGNNISTVSVDINGETFVLTGSEGTLNITPSSETSSGTYTATFTITDTLSNSYVVKKQDVDITVLVTATITNIPSTVYGNTDFDVSVEGTSSANVDHINVVYNGVTKTIAGSGTTTLDGTVTFTADNVSTTTTETVTATVYDVNGSSSSTSADISVITAPYTVTRSGDDYVLNMDTTASSIVVSMAIDSSSNTFVDISTTSNGGASVSIPITAYPWNRYFYIRVSEDGTDTGYTAGPLRRDINTVAVGDQIAQSFMHDLVHAVVTTINYAKAAKPELTDSVSEFTKSVGDIVYFSDLQGIINELNLYAVGIYIADHELILATDINNIVQSLAEFGDRILAAHSNSEDSISTSESAQVVANTANSETVSTSSSMQQLSSNEQADTANPSDGTIASTVTDDGTYKFDSSKWDFAEWD